MSVKQICLRRGCRKKALFFGRFCGGLCMDHALDAGLDELHAESRERYAALQSLAGSDHKMSDAKRLEKIKHFCIGWLDPKHLEDGYITSAERLTLQGVWKVGEFGPLPYPPLLGELVEKKASK